MFGSLGLWELVFIFVLALLIFGPKRLPQIGRTLGKGMAEFRKASNDLKQSIEREINLDEPAPRIAPRPAPAIAQKGTTPAEKRESTPGRAGEEEKVEEKEPERTEPMGESEAASGR